MSGALTLEELRKAIEEESIDTVLVAFPDHFGRLIGKRVIGSFFLDHTVQNGMDLCDYLLSVDIDMKPLPGFSMSSWEKGYGDFHGVADLKTLRLIPWLEATALVLCDLESEDGAAIVQSPRAILRHQIQRMRKDRLFAKMGSELEFYLFDEPHDEIAERNFQQPHPTSQYIIDYHILHTSRDEPIIREMRNSINRAGIPVEFSKGEWGRGQYEINLVYDDALEMADRHVVFKNGIKEIAWAKGHSATFMAKYDETEAGSSFHLHTSVWNEENDRNVLWDKDKREGSEVFRQFLGGLLKYSQELFLFFAPTVNSYKRYQAGTFAPTRVAWATDNRTTGFRVIGRGPSFRIENRMPGADANPYLAYAATLAAGLAGMAEGLDCGEPFEGDAYQATDLARVPANLNAAADQLENSALAKTAFGEEVVEHYVRLARLEQQASDAAVTDWERRRYFDRI